MRAVNLVLILLTFGIANSTFAAVLEDALKSGEAVGFILAKVPQAGNPIQYSYQAAILGFGSDGIQNMGTATGSTEKEAMNALVKQYHNFKKSDVQVTPDDIGFEFPNRLLENIHTASTADGTRDWQLIVKGPKYPNGKDQYDVDFQINSFSTPPTESFKIVNHKGGSTLAEATIPFNDRRFRENQMIRNFLGNLDENLKKLRTASNHAKLEAIKGVLIDKSPEVYDLDSSLLRSTIVSLASQAEGPNPKPVVAAPARTEIVH